MMLSSSAHSPPTSCLHPRRRYKRPRNLHHHCHHKHNQSNISRDDCENDLAEAIPALQSAINSLNTLKPSDITVVRNIAKLRDHSIFYFPVKFKDLCIEVTKRNSGEKYEEPSAHRKVCH